MVDLLKVLQERLSLAGPPTRSEPGVRATSAISLYREGLTTLAQLRDQLRHLGYAGVHLDRLVFSAELDRELEIATRRPPPGRPTAVGMVIIPEEQFITQERPRRPTAVGMVLAAAGPAAPPTQPPRPTSVGMVITVT